MANGFRPDSNLYSGVYATQPQSTTDFYGGRAGAFNTLFRPDPTLDAKKAGNATLRALGSFGYAMVEPLVEYTKMPIESLYQAGRHIGGYAFDPTYRSAAQKAKRGEALTEAEAQATLKSGPEWLFDTSKEFAITTPSDAETTARDRWDAVWNPALKRTAAAEAYVAPALLGFGPSGNIVYQGGMPVMQALAGGTTVGGLKAGVGKHMALGGARGLISGGLSGYGYSEPGKELESTLKGMGVSGAIGLATGYRGGKLAEKSRKQLAEANRLMFEKQFKPTSKLAAKGFGGWTRIASRRENRGLDTKWMSERLLDQGAPTFNSIDDAVARAQVITGREGELVGKNGVMTNLVDAALDGADEQVQVDDIAGHLQKAMGGTMDLTDRQINDWMQRTMQATPSPDTTSAFHRALINAGFREEDIPDIMRVAAESGTITQTGGVARRLMGLGFDIDQADEAASIIMNTNPMAGTKVGHVSAQQAMDLNRELEKQYRYYVTGNTPKDKTIADALNKASNVLDDRLNNVSGNGDRMLAEWAANPDYKAMLNWAYPGNEFTPALGDQVDDYLRMMGPDAKVAWMRSMQAPSVQLLKAAYATERAPQLLEQSAQGVAARLAAAGLGMYAGGPVPAIIGYIGAPAIAPILGTIQERATVPITTGGARMINALANEGWKAYGLRGLSALREGRRNLLWENPWLWGPAQGLGRRLFGGDQEMRMPSIPQPQREMRYTVPESYIPPTHLQGTMYQQQQIPQYIQQQLPAQMSTAPSTLAGTEMYPIPPEMMSQLPFYYQGYGGGQ